MWTVRFASNLISNISKHTLLLYSINNQRQQKAPPLQKKKKKKKTERTTSRICSATADLYFSLDQQRRLRTYQALPLGRHSSPFLPLRRLCRKPEAARTEAGFSWKGGGALGLVCRGGCGGREVRARGAILALAQRRSRKGVGVSGQAGVRPQRLQRWSRSPSSPFSPRSWGRGGCPPPWCPREGIPVARPGRQAENKQTFSGHLNPFPADFGNCASSAPAHGGHRSRPSRPVPPAAAAVPFIFSSRRRPLVLLFCSRLLSPYLALPFLCNSQCRSGFLAASFPSFSGHLPCVSSVCAPAFLRPSPPPFFDRAPVFATIPPSSILLLKFHFRTSFLRTTECFFFRIRRNLKSPGVYRTLSPRLLYVSVFLSSPLDWQWL